MNYNIKTVINKEFGEIKRTLAASKIPESVIWFLTERCNLTCGHCFVSHKGRVYRNEMNYDQIKSIIDSFQGSLKKISFTGGEPLIFKDFSKVFLYASSLAQMNELHVSTNGMLNDKLFSTLGECNNDQVQYSIQSSIDGPEEIHNKIRGNKRAFKEVIQLLKLFYEFKSKSKLSLNLHLVMTVSRLNQYSVLETMELAQTYNIPVTLNFVRSSTDSKLDKSEISDFIPQESDNNELSIEEINSVIATWCRFAEKYYEFFVYKLNKTRMQNVLYYYKKGIWQFPCSAGINNAVIFSDGSVSICETKKPFAKLQDFDLNYRKLWKEHYTGKMHTCFCSYDCAMDYSINKSAKGHWVAVKELIGI